MRICVITSSFPLNRQDARAAAGLFVRDFAVALHELGHEVHVLTPDKVGEGREDPPGVAVTWFPWHGGQKTLSTMKPYLPWDAWSMLSLFRQGQRALEEIGKRWPIDHTLAMWAVPSGYLAMRHRRRGGPPFTSWCLGSDIWTYGRYPVLRGVVQRVLRASDLLYADGLALAGATEALAGRPAPFLPSSRRLRSDLTGPAELPKEGCNFLFIGRYAEVKGVDVLLDAWAAYLREGGRGHLHMFGGGPWDDKVRQRAAQADVQAHVTVGGFAGEETVVSYMKAVDCVVIPSRMESIPVILSDALQMQRPVIVSDVGDMGRLLQETPAGHVVPAEDVAALTQAMHAVAAAPSEQYAAHVAQLAARFDIQACAQAWLDDVARLTT